MRSFGSALVASLFLLACGSSQKPANDMPLDETPAAADAAPAEVTPVEAKPVEPPPPTPGDVVAVAPDMFKVLVENESVRVLEVTFAPGAKVGLVTRPDRVVYSISGSKLRTTPLEGEATETELKAGEVKFLPAAVHSIENVGGTETKAVVVELRKKGAAAPEGKSAEVVGPKVYKVLFEDEHVRVFEITFVKKAKIGVHSHPDHVAYVLAGGKLEITGADKKAQTLELPAGAAVFLPAQAHSAKNVGTTEVKAVLFEIKP